MVLRSLSRVVLPSSVVEVSARNALIASERNRTGAWEEDESDDCPAATGTLREPKGPSVEGWSWLLGLLLELLLEPTPLAVC